MIGKDGLGDPPMARDTDPETSHQAAASLKDVYTTHREIVLELTRRTGARGLALDGLKRQWPYPDAEKSSISPHWARLHEDVDPPLCLPAKWARIGAKGKWQQVWLHWQFATPANVLLEGESRIEDLADPRCQKLSRWNE